MWITMCKVYFPIKNHVDSFVEKNESYLQAKFFDVENKVINNLLTSY